MSGPIRARWLILLWAIVITVLLLAMWRVADAPRTEVVHPDLEPRIDSLATAPPDSSPRHPDAVLARGISPMNRGTSLPGSASSSASSQQPPFSPTRVDEILESMQRGSIAFNTPSEMKLEESSYIHLLLDATKSIEELKAMIAGTETKVGASVRFSAAMEARLTGTAFQITTITSERQAISATQVTEWKWDVRPTDTGQQYLHLTLTAILDVDGSFTPRTIETFERTIEVRVTGWRRVTRMFYRNWEWLWTLVILPLSATAWYLWNRKVSRGRRVGF